MLPLLSITFFNTLLTIINRLCYVIYNTFRIFMVLKERDKSLSIKLLTNKINRNESKFKRVKRISTIYRGF